MTAHEMRRLQAIMFTDMVGYTALGQRNEVLSLALVEEQRKVVRPILARHGGSEVKTIGDAFLVVFPSAVDAVRCAYDIQRATREFNLTLTADRRIHLRVGIHVGEVVESKGDVMGDAVNVASRIEPLAEEGGVCVSRQVYDQVANKLELRLESIGVKGLKNVLLPVEVFKVVMPWGEGPLAPASLDRKRVAVLPLTNLSPNADDRYFADGMTEELISAISRVPGLSVISRTSTMRFRDPSKSVPEIGRELGAGTLIEGSVRKAGNRVRITAQLIDARTDNHLWVENYDRDLDDVFAIQSDVASKVAGSLQTRLLGGKEWKDTDDMEAYTMYVRATQLYHEGSQAGYRSALALLQQATARDPNFVRALALLAETWGELIGDGYEKWSELPKAEEAARLAVEKGPEWAEAHVAMSLVFMTLDRFAESIAHAERAVQINPSLAKAWQTLGYLNMTFGTLEEALPAFRRADELDPLSSGGGIMHAVVCWFMGRHAEALGIFQRLFDLNPGNPAIHLALARMYVSTGDYVMAQKVLDKVRELEPGIGGLQAVQGIIFARTGRRKEAERELALAAESGSEVVRLGAQFSVNYALGNLDEAFRALMKQAEAHTWVPMIRFAPMYAELRKDPRYTDFCKAVGIPS